METVNTIATIISYHNRIHFKRLMSTTVNTKTLGLPRKIIS